MKYSALSVGKQRSEAYVDRNEHAFEFNELFAEILQVILVIEYEGIIKKFEWFEQIGNADDQAWHESPELAAFVFKF